MSTSGNGVGRRFGRLQIHILSRRLGQESGQTILKESVNATSRRYNAHQKASRINYDQYSVLFLANSIIRYPVDSTFMSGEIEGCSCRDTQIRAQSTLIWETHPEYRLVTSLPGICPHGDCGMLRRRNNSIVTSTHCLRKLGSW
jgi:hypothetical protein